MSLTIDLPADVLARAAQWLFASEWASAREAAGFRFRPRTEITDICPPLDTATLVKLIRPYVARLADAWDMGVGAMFALMQIPESKHADALYYVLMGCRGHGIGLADDFGDNISIAEDKLGKGIDPAPFHDESLDFYDLTTTVVESEARRPDDDPDPDALYQPGDQVQVDSRMPTGDRVMGLGAVVRWITEGSDMSAGEGVIVAMDDGEGVEPWCYRGSTIFVEADACELLADGERAAMGQA